MRKRIFTDEDLKSLVAEGLTRQEMAERLHCSVSTVCNHCKRLGFELQRDRRWLESSPKHLMRLEQKKAQRERTEKRRQAHDTIVKMRANNSPYSDIAIAAGVTKEYVINFCRGRKIGYSSEETQKACGQYRNDEMVANNIAELGRGVSYVSGYLTKDSLITLRHDVCRHEFEMTYHGIAQNPGRPLRCPVCSRIRKEQKRKQQAADRTTWNDTCCFCGKTFEPKSRHSRFCSKDCREQYYRAIIHQKCTDGFVPEVRECKYCGREFMTEFKWRSEYCSERCRKKSLHKSTLYQRIKSKNQIINEDITLPKLYERDGGVCYICGKTCDWNDKYMNDDGYWVYGNTYPSIDHVVPLAKMGPHSWDNIKLACRYCNAIKGADEAKEAV